MVVWVIFEVFKPTKRRFFEEFFSAVKQ